MRQDNLTMKITLLLDEFNKSEGQIKFLPPTQLWKYMKRSKKYFLNK